MTLRFQTKRSLLYLASLLLLLLSGVVTKNHHHLVEAQQQQQQQQQELQQQEGDGGGGMQATWTPNANDDDSSGPLPLSMKQRQELLRLEQAIANAPDPQATLLQVADANQMDPQDLINMLQRNRRDLEQGGGGSGGGNGNIWQSLAALSVASRTWIQKRPRWAAGLTATAAVAAYTTWTIPRTGLVLSTTRKSMFLSKGATTVFAPPVAYLQDAMARNSRRPLSVVQPNTAVLATDLEYPDNNNNNNNQGQATWLNTQKSSNTNNKRTLRAGVTVTSDLWVDDLRGNQKKFESVEAIVVLEAAWEQAVHLVTKQCALTEFCTDKNAVRLYMDNTNNNEENGDDDDDDDDDTKDGILVVRGLGDWGAYGLVPLRRISSTTFDTEQDSTVVLTLHTVKGAHWDGQVQVKLDLQSNDDDDDDEHCLSIRVTLLVPKKGGRAPPRRIAEGIVQALHDSIVTSIRTRTRQTLARTSQSVRFQNAARQKASTRRSTRAAKERAIEEMQEDRRRRWQRSNPNAGSYRPSGDRMRSPNNAVYK